MMRGFLKLVALGTGLMLFAGGASSVGRASLAQGDCTVIVQPGQSIQKTIDEAFAGAVICLTAGTFRENVKIEKSLTLQGVTLDQTSIKSRDAGQPVVRVNSNVEIEVLFKNLTLAESVPFSTMQLCAREAWPRLCPYGLQVEGKSKVTLNQVALSSNFSGGLAEDSAHVSFNDSQISNSRSSGFLVQGAACAQLRGSRISGSGASGLLVADSAIVQVHESLIQANRACGLWVASEAANVAGTLNEIRGNGADLCGFAPVSIRKPLVAQTERTELNVPGDFNSLQEAVDAIAPGGTIRVAASGEGVTLWKPLTLRGAGNGQAILPLLSVIAEAHDVTVERVRVTSEMGVGLLLYGRAQVREIEIVNNVLAVFIDGSAEVSLNNLQVSNNLFGLRVVGSAQVSLSNSKISRNFFSGVEVSNSARLRIVSSQIAHQFLGSGLIAEDFAHVHVSESQVISNAEDGVALAGSAEVSLANSVISLNRQHGLFVRDSARVHLSESQLWGNRLAGLTLFDSTQANLQEVQIFGNDVGVFLKDSARLQLTKTRVANNGNGLDVGGKVVVNVHASEISNNRSHGLFIRDTAAVDLENSVLEGNGIDSTCVQVDVICNGIEVRDQATLKLRDATIRENTDWGMAAYLRPCGYPQDAFSGQVTFEGSNVIASNNKSGNHSEGGNPGHHPFQSSPHGQVCLP